MALQTTEGQRSQVGAEVVRAPQTEEPAPGQNRPPEKTPAKKSPLHSNADPCQEARMVFEKMVEALADALSMDDVTRARGRRAIRLLSGEHV